MAVSKSPRGASNKLLTKSEVDKWFIAESIEELILLLREYKRDKLLNYEITMSKEFADMERATQDLIARSHVLKPLDPFGVLSRGKFGITIKTASPLSDVEINSMLKTIPSDILTKYLRFKLFKIDFKRFQAMIQVTCRDSPNTNGSKGYDRVAYKNLVVAGSTVQYLGNHIDLSFQEQQIVRLLLSAPDSVISYDEFFDDPDIFNKPTEQATLSKLVSKVHGKLKSAIGKQCIFNKRYVGWRLSLD